MSEPAILAYGPCLLCKRPFAFHPERVPSHPWPPPDGPRAPICSTCIVVVNERRAAGGLPTWPIPAGAYGPADPSVLDGV